LYDPLAPFAPMSSAMFCPELNGRLAGRIVVVVVAEF